MQQSPPYSTKRNEGYIHAEKIMKSPLFFAPEDFCYA